MNVSYVKVMAYENGPSFLAQKSQTQFLKRPKMNINYYYTKVYGACHERSRRKPDKNKAKTNPIKANCEYSKKKLNIINFILVLYKYRFNIINIQRNIIKVICRKNRFC